METNKNNIKNELQELKAEQLLKHLVDKNNIPKDYFENLSFNVISDLKEEDLNNKPLRKKSINIFIPFAIASAVILFFAIPLLTNTQKNISWNQFSQNDFRKYIEENITDFSEEEIASISDLSEISLLINTPYSNEELEDYLLELEIEEEELF